MPLQLTLALIKPDVSVNPLRLHFVRKKMLKNGFLIVRSKKLKLSLNEAELFYQVHKDKFFFNRLVTYMCSGVTYSHILAREDAIATWRKLMGPTKVFQAIYEAPNTIRGSIGLTDTRNSTHGSDSPISVEQEIKFFFPEFDPIKWHRKDEIKFRRKLIIFDPRSFVHRPIKLNKY